MTNALRNPPALVTVDMNAPVVHPVFAAILNSFFDPKPAPVIKECGIIATHYMFENPLASDDEEGDE